MKFFLLFLISILFFQVSKAATDYKTDSIRSRNLPGGNGRITGTVMDSSSRQPVEFATVSIFPQGSTKPVDGTVTDNKGSFRIQALQIGTYRVNISFIGYRAKNRIVIIGPSSYNVNLGRINLSSNSVALKGVTVTTQRDLIENRIDKMVFNAEKDITSQVGAATDVLRKVPQISVDVDGNVELRGSQNVRVLINGKPSTILATSLADALQSIPANQIKSIEVITNPSAKYDAEGTAGIINIILKKSTAKGVNGNINTSVGTRFENGTLNLTARRGTFGVNAGVSGNELLPNTGYTTSTRITTDSLGRHSTLHQAGSTHNIRNGYNANFGVDWDISEKDNFTSSIRYNNFGRGGNGPLRQNAVFDAGLPVKVSGAQNFPDITRNSNSTSRVKGYDWNTDYKHMFNDQGREFDASYQYSVNDNNTYYSQQQYKNIKNATDSLFSGQRSSNLGRSVEQNIQLDYTEPISKTTKLEVGAKAVIRDITSNSTGDSLNRSQFVPDGRLTNVFDYHQKIYAGYALLTFKASKWLDVYGGLRVEHTDNKANFSAQQGINIPSYNTYIPSLTLSHTINQTQTIKASYTRRVQRPGFNTLNPFYNVSDPNTITTGNPFLAPELTQSAELTYNTFLGKGSSINVALYYRFTADDIQPYLVPFKTTTIDGSAYSNVLVSTPENIGRQKLTGLNLFGSVPFTRKFTVRANANLFIDDLTNISDPRQNSNTFDYNLNANASYNFLETLSGEFFGFFNSPRRTVQGRNPSFSFYNFGIRKQLWKKKGSIALTASSPFNAYRYFNSQVNGPGFSQSTERKVPFRSIGINFNYSFGKLNYTDKKKFNSKPSESDSNQGGDDPEGGGGGSGGGGGRSGGGGGRAGGRGSGAAAAGAPGAGYGGSGGKGGRPGEYIRNGAKRDSLQRRDSSSSSRTDSTLPSRPSVDSNRVRQPVTSAGNRGDSTVGSPAPETTAPGTTPAGTQPSRSMSQPAGNPPSRSRPGGSGGTRPKP